MKFISFAKQGYAVSDVQQSAELKHLIERAVSKGIRSYIEKRRARIAGFVASHFSFHGALQLHKKAFWKDFLIVPVNILWSMPLLLLRILAMLLKAMGFVRPAGLLNRLPAGFQTAVQDEFNRLIYSELLELPYKQAGRETTKDALLEEILNEPQLAAFIAQQLSKIHVKSLAPEFRQILQHNLAEYATSRTAAADMAGSVITLASGFAVFHKATPGALASGSAAAAAIAQKLAIAKFWLGSALGTWYYSVFPVAVSTGLRVAATASIMAGLAFIMPIAGIITDPLQAALGIHQKRLHKFLDAFQAELLGEKVSDYRLKDQYFARVMDIIDVLKIALRS